MEIDLDRSTRKQTGTSKQEIQIRNLGGDSDRSTKENKKEEKCIVILELVALTHSPSRILIRG
jgi:hypothetical protein